MTEYELLSAAQGQTNILLINLTAMFSIMTAYLAVGFLAAHRISLAMALFVTALFLLWCLTSLMLGLGTTLVGFNITAEMRAQAHAGRAFLWWPGLARETGGFGYFAAYTAFVVVVAANLGAVYFFFECRWRNMKADAAMKA